MSGLGKRLARLEVGGEVEGYLPLLTLDDLVIGDGDDPVRQWPADTSGVRFCDGSERLRRHGEGLAVFRARLSIEHGVRGPAGALPFAMVDLMRH